LIRSKQYELATQGLRRLLIEYGDQMTQNDEVLMGKLVDFLDKEKERLEFEEMMASSWLTKPNRPERKDEQ
jgi:hypothetical protein